MRRIWIAVLLLVIMLFAACASAEPVEFLGGKDKQNDVKITSDKLSVRLKGYDDNNKAYRWYSMTANEESDLAFTLYSTDIRMYLYVYDETGNELYSAAPTVGNYVTYTKRVSAGEKLYFRLERYSSSDFGNYEFEAEMTTASAPYLFLGGKNMQYAVEVTSDKLAKWHLGYDDNIKGNRYYIITAQNDTKLNLTVNATDGEVRLRFYAKNGNNLTNELNVKAGAYTTYSVELKKGETVTLAQWEYDYSRNHYWQFAICMDGQHGESSDWAVELNPTCTDDGLKAKKCVICGDITEQEILPALGHVTAEGTVTTEPTCIAKGTLTYYCTVCGGTVSTEELALVDHIPMTMNCVRSATCVSDGVYEQRCSVCNVLLNNEVIPAYGHSAGEWYITKKATCTADGIREQRCASCSEVLVTETIPALGHSLGEMIIVREAGCCVEGKKEISCSICSYVSQVEVIPAREHQFTKWDTVVEPTSSEAGKKLRYCTLCGECEYEDINKLPSYFRIF